MSSIIETIREVLALRRNGYSGPFFMGVLLVGVGLWLILPWEIFSTSNSYELMAELGSEELWAVITGGTGLVILVSALSRKPREVALGCVVGAGVWFALFCSAVAASPMSLRVPVSFILTARCVSLFQEFRTQFNPVSGVPYPHSHADHKREQYNE